MKKDKQSIQSSIIEISSKDNVTKEIIMLVHKIDVANANGLDFKLEYVEKFKDTLLNKPVVTKYYPEINDLGDHEAIFDKNGNIVGLETIAIGTIKEVWIGEYKTDTEDIVKALYAKADLWNYKYPQIIACIEKLFNEKNADSSVEVEIYEYGENPTKEYRYPVDYSYLANCLLGSSVSPADADAGIKEISMAAHEDLKNLKLNSLEGGEKMDKKELFNKGKEIIYRGSLEANALKFDEIRSQIYNLLNPVNPQTNVRKYNYWIYEIYNEYVIVCDWDTDTIMYRINYEIVNDTVSLAPQSEWVEGRMGFIPNGVDVNQLLTQVTELNNKIEELKKEAKANMDKTVEELQAELSAKEKEIADFKTKVEELEKKVEELNETIVSQETTKKELESTIDELNNNIQELTKYKERVEKAEKEAKIAELNEKYSKLLPEEVFNSEEVQNAIQELNSVKLNEIVVNEVTKQKIESKPNDADIVISSKKQEDLLEEDLSAKYGLSI